MKCEHLSVLALYPTYSGYAYVYFEKPSKIINWGGRRIPGPLDRRNVKAMIDVEALLEKYQPDYVAVEDWTVQGSRRSGRIRRLYRSIVHTAETRAIEVRRYSKGDIARTYASVGAVSRYEIAQATAREFPALAHRLPSRRKAWESERSVMALFFAAALALTFYSSHQDSFENPASPH